MSLLPDTVRLCDDVAYVVIGRTGRSSMSSRAENEAEVRSRVEKLRASGCEVVQVFDYGAADCSDVLELLARSFKEITFDSSERTDQ